MPTAVDVIFFKDDAGTTPVLAWLDKMERRDRRMVAKCWVRLELPARKHLSA